MSTSAATEAKSSKKGQKKLATLDKVMKGSAVYKKFVCCSNSWEANELYSTLTFAHQLEKIVTVAGIKPSGSGVYHRLPRDEEIFANGLGQDSPMHRTAPTQLFLNHAQVFTSYRKEDLNVRDLVTTFNCRRAKLILESQSVEDFKLSKDASGRASWEETEKEKTPVWPNFPFPVQNSGAPGASTSSAYKSPLNIHFVPSAQDYANLRPVEFDKRLYSFWMPHSWWADNAKGFYFSNLSHFLGQSRMGSGPPVLILLDHSSFMTSSWFLPSDSFLRDDDTSFLIYKCSRAELDHHEPIEDLLDALAQAHSPKKNALKHPRVVGGPVVEASGNQEVVLIDEEEEERVDTLGPSADSGIPSKVDEYPAPPGIILTPAHPNEERIQLRIAKHNNVVEELSKGDAEAEALKKWLREAQDGPFLGEYTGDVWDLTFDPMMDWFKCFAGPNLASFASEMLRDSEALRDEALVEKALMERDHQAALNAKDDIITSGRKDLRDSKEEN
uniref:Uncharacterized protein n=1 Tax=Cannabis sativa TaxID=3483 RepID=A0A803P4B2_CANSA